MNMDPGHHDVIIFTELSQQQSDELRRKTARLEEVEGGVRRAVCILCLHQLLVYENEVMMTFREVDLIQYIFSFSEIP